MALSLADVDELIVLIQQDPVLRDRVRNAILAEDFLALPAAMARMSDRIDALAETIDRFAAETRAQFAKIDGQFAKIDGQFARVDGQFARVDGRLDKLEGRVGNVEGSVYEIGYRDNLPSRLGRRFEKVRRIHVVDIPGVSKALAAGVISEDEWEDLLLIDVAALARPRGGHDETVVMLELSRVVDVSDVTRAYRRAEIVRKAGVAAEACVDGESIVPEARAEAVRLGVTALVSKEGAAA